MCLSQYSYSVVSNVRFKGNVFKRAEWYGFLHVRPHYHPRVFLPLLCKNLFLCHRYSPPVCENHVFHACMTTCNNCKVSLPKGRATLPHIALCVEYNINLSPEAMASWHTSRNIWICAAAYSGHFSFAGLFLVQTLLATKAPHISGDLRGPISQFKKPL